MHRWKYKEFLHTMRPMELNLKSAIRGQFMFCNQLLGGFFHPSSTFCPLRKVRWQQNQAGVGTDSATTLLLGSSCFSRQRHLSSSFHPHFCQYHRYSLWRPTLRKPVNRKGGQRLLVTHCIAPWKAVRPTSKMLRVKAEENTAGCMCTFRTVRVYLIHLSYCQKSQRVPVRPTEWDKRKHVHTTHGID